MQEVWVNGGAAAKRQRNRQRENAWRLVSEGADVIISVQQAWT